MTARKVEFLSEGQKIKGVLYLHKKSPLIIICHGFTGNKDTRIMRFLSGFLYKNGYSVLKFDFRGSGESEGEFTGVKDEVDDLKQAYRLARKYSKKIILLGHSLGGGIIALSKIKPRAVIMINPAFSAEFVAFSFLRRAIPFFWIQKVFRKIHIFTDRTFEEIEAVGRLASRSFRFRLGEEAIDEANILSVRTIANVHSPLFLIHGTKDKTIHMGSTKQAYYLAHKPKEICFIEGADHNFHNYKHKIIAVKKILSFLNENGLKGTAKK